MDDTVIDLDFRPRPTVERPLLGLTILVVEDSRFSSEAMRLLCLRSGARQAMTAGADGFLPKPLESLAEFQAAIIRHMPGEMRPKGPRPITASAVRPDMIAYREDLSHAMDLLALDDPPLGYLRRFLLGVARTARDGGLEERAQGMAQGLAQAERRALRAFLSHRIQTVPMAM